MTVPLDAAALRHLRRPRGGGSGALDPDASRNYWGLLGWPAAMALAAPLLAWLAHAILGRQIATLSASGWAWCLVGAPLMEEAIFRWGLQQSLAQAWMRAGGRPGWLTQGLANLLASFAFVISHQPGMPLWGRLDLLVPSLALGALWSLRRQYWLCVCMHAWFNLCLAAMTGLL